MSRPAWSRSASITEYGGHLNKANYMGQGLIDARTDVGAEHINRIADDLQRMVRCAPFLVARLRLNDAAPAAPTVQWCAFQPAGQVTVSFAGGSPPTGYPTFSRLGNGTMRITFDASYADEYGNVETTALRDAGGSGSGAVFANVQSVVTGTNTVEFYVFNSSGTALSDSTISVKVY